MELNQVTLPAADVAASVAFYRSMGFTLIVDAPRYARFKSTIGDATFSIHAVEPPFEASRTIVYFECAALDQTVAELKAKGLRFTQQPRDEPWLWREARLVDPSGNVICLYHAGTNRLDPPWRVGARCPASDTNALVFSAFDTPPDASLRVVDSGLDKYNHSAAPLADVRSLASFATDHSGRVVGGAVGRTWGRCCELLQLWVDEESRSTGVGSRLLRQFEEHAGHRGCDVFYLTTLSFQAPAFYRKHGYVPLAEISGYPDGITKYLMQKTIA